MRSSPFIAVMAYRSLLNSQGGFAPVSGHLTPHISSILNLGPEPLDANQQAGPRPDDNAQKAKPMAVPTFALLPALRLPSAVSPLGRKTDPRELTPFRFSEELRGILLFRKRLTPDRHPPSAIERFLLTTASALENPRMNTRMPPSIQVRPARRLLKQRSPSLVHGTLHQAQVPVCVDNSLLSRTWLPRHAVGQSTFSQDSGQLTSGRRLRTSTPCAAAMQAAPGGGFAGQADADLEAPANDALSDGAMK
jgi:hypothetical protein